MDGRIFITGGTGSLGRAIVERAERERWGARLTIYSRDEVKQSELRTRYPRHRYVLGDVRDAEWLTIAMRGHDLVIHAAAYKQVPSSEVNASQAIETNVIGSRNVALAAVQLGIPTVVGISTDKACSPVNLYGESKACMEKLFQQACLWGSTSFLLVRYGNVVGSRGSVVPLLQAQAAQGGPLTITDPRMTRFWLTLDEAVDLILAAIDRDARGSVLIPKAPASDMATLAEAVAPGVPTEVIGIRAGEKVHEQLVHSAEAMHADDVGDYYCIYPAYEGRTGNLPEGFEYRSDSARRMGVQELRSLLVRSGERVGVPA